MSLENLTIDRIDAINERLHKANGIVGMIRVSNHQASEYAIEHAAWAVEGLLDEIETIINGKAIDALPEVAL